jgi:hypothetical protein
VADVALSWRRARTTPTHEREAVQSVPDVVEQLKHLAAQLNTEVQRLEHVNDVAQRRTEESP